ncbi:hypothetical protein GCM10028895_26270 [Pontibacter rugosus]
MRAKEKEAEQISARAREEMYQDAWWEFYKAQNKGEEPRTAGATITRSEAPTKNTAGFSCCI